MEDSQNINFKNINLKSRIFCFTFIFLFLVFVLFLRYFLSALSPVSKVSDIKQIEIKSGEGFQQISLDLRGAGIIRSDVAFRLVSLISGSAHKLKPGLYSLDSSLSTLNILKKIIIGPDLERGVVIPEGFTFLDIDKKLSDAGIIQPKALANFSFDSIKNNYEFLKELKSPINIEGYLFPDTYKFFINSKPEDVVKKILDNFNTKAWPVLKGQNRIVGETSFGHSQFINIASLLEKEASDFKDRQKIAGIIYRRLAIGMPLQIDATIIYAKCGGFIVYCDNLNFNRKDTNFISPYNTYLHNGLPPAPISNPGLDSINAALHPEQSDYLYYLSDPKTHKIIFSKTLEEQNENRAIYLGL